MILSFGSFYEKCVARFEDWRARHVEREQRAQLAREHANFRQLILARHPAVEQKLYSFRYHSNKRIIRNCLGQSSQEAYDLDVCMDDA